MGRGQRRSMLQQETGRTRMESSDEEDDYPSHEWITPQSQVNSSYQSHTEKGIRNLCSELLDLKEAVENIDGSAHSKCMAFLRLPEEVIEIEHEIVDLHKHISAQGILVQDLINGVCQELEMWGKCDDGTPQFEEDSPSSLFRDLCPELLDAQKLDFLETMDVLLTEYRVNEAAEVLEAEEKSFLLLLETKNEPSAQISAYKVAFLERKSMLIDQLVAVTERPSASISELKEAVTGLFKLGEGLRAHKLFLKAFEYRLSQSIEAHLSSYLIHSETYAAAMSQIVFSSIVLAAKESKSIFGDAPAYTSSFQQWVEREIESYVHLVRENSPPFETSSALFSASVCMQSGFTYCSILDSQGLKSSKVLGALLHPYFEEVLEMNFRRVKKLVFDLAADEDVVPVTHQQGYPLSPSIASKTVLSNSGARFMTIVMDIVEHLTPVAVFHFGGNILQRLAQLFDKYVECLLRVLPGPSEDDIFIEPRASLHFRVETDSQQLALLGTAFVVADELLPAAVSKIFYPQFENTDLSNGSENTSTASIGHYIEYKDWRRQLQHSLDKLRDHFCRQYVLSFIYSREGKTRLDAWIYIEERNGDTYEPTGHLLPSLPFQAFFARLQQLAIIAGDMLVGKEKVQKILLARLTETVVMWLSDEQEFWGILEDESTILQVFGLQQIVLDMHFIVEMMIYGGYPSKHVHQLASAIITRAIQTYSNKGVDLHSALPAEEWFVSTAKAAINQLLLSERGFAPGEIDCSSADSDGSISSLSSESAETFVSASMEQVDSPDFISSPEG